MKPVLFAAFCSAYATILLAQATIDTNAVIIDLQKTNKTCPAGYQADDEVCSRTIYADAEMLCTDGVYNTTLRLCVMRIAREATCLPGFTRVNAHCIQNRSTLKIRMCPEGAALRTNDSMCVLTTENPPQEACPAGSTASGGRCYISSLVPAVYVCPDGFTLDGTICFMEENYLCSPGPCITTTRPTTRPPLEGGLTTTTTRTPTGGGKEDNAALALANLRNARLAPDFTINLTKGSFNDYTGNSQSGLENGSSLTYTDVSLTEDARSAIYFTDFSSPQIKPAHTWSVYRSSPLYRRRMQESTETTEVLTQHRCRRRRTVNATLFCAEGTLTNGQCQITTTVDTILIPSGYNEVVNPPMYSCPAGYIVDTSNPNQCVNQLITTPEYICPASSTSSDSSCMTTSNPTINCPSAFVYSNGRCTQTQTVPFQVEYVIRYQCQGKSCEPNATTV